MNFEALRKEVDPSSQLGEGEVYAYAILQCRRATRDEGELRRIAEALDVPAGDATLSGLLNAIEDLRTTVKVLARNL